MASLILTTVPDGLAATCVFAALSIGVLFGILIMCLLSIGKGGDHGP